MKSIIRDLVFIYIGYKLLTSSFILYGMMILGFTLYFRIGKITG